MALSAVPGLIDALATRASAAAALSGVTVCDGYGVTDTSADLLLIGVEDPDIEGAAFSADVTQQWATVGTGAAADETGSVTCAAVSWNGNSGNAGQKAARDAVFAIAAAVSQLCKDSPSLGVAELLWTRFGSQLQLMQNQDEQGSIATLVFRINFHARV